MVPAGKRAAFEMIEPEVGLEFAILLLDGPPLVHEPHEPRPRRRGRQVHEGIFGLGRVARVAFGQQPDLRRESPVVAPVVGGGYAQGHTVDRPPPDGPAIAPTDASSPRMRRGDGGDRGRGDILRQRRPGARASVAAAGRPHKARPSQEHGLRRRHPHRIRESPCRCNWARNRPLSPYSASASTPVTVRPLARAWRSKVSARRHFS